MKKTISSVVIAVTLLLVGNYQASAQCGETGFAYYCSAYAQSLDRVTNLQQWATTNSDFTISVTLEVYEEGEDAYVSVVFGNYRWAHAISSGSYEDNFYAYGGPTQSIQLFTTAKGGHASIAAAW